MSKDLVKTVEELLESGRGDKAELQFILEQLKDGRAEQNTKTKLGQFRLYDKVVQKKFQDKKSRFSNFNQQLRAFPHRC